MANRTSPSFSPRCQETETGSDSQPQQLLRPYPPDCIFSGCFEAAQNNPLLGIWNIDNKPAIDGMNMNLDHLIINSHWNPPTTSFFLGNAVNNSAAAALISKTASTVSYEIASSPMEVISPPSREMSLPGSSHRGDQVHTHPIIDRKPVFSEHGSWVQLYQSGGLSVSPTGNLQMGVSGFHDTSRYSTPSQEVTDKTMEKKRRRMIKNRESAARSRAKKQAYMRHLENKLTQLRKMNSWFKKVKGLMGSNSISIPRYQLRRTSSAAF